MRLVFIGSGSFALPTLRVLHSASFEIPLVITQPDRPAGRGLRVVATAVSTLARQWGLEVVCAADVNDAALIERVRACNAAVGVVIAFGQKIRESFRAAMPGGCVNLHASLLPHLRGAAPYQWTVLRGDAQAGVTVFRLVDRMDAGPLLTQARTDVGSDETADELHDRLAELGPNAMLEALRLFEHGQVPEGAPQDEAQVTLAPKLKKTDGHLHMEGSVNDWVRRVHGCWSWPGAICRFQSADHNRDEQVILARVGIASRDACGGEPGTLDAALRVRLRDGTIEIRELKPMSGRLMAWSDFVNGRRVKPGDRLTAVTA